MESTGLSGGRWMPRLSAMSVLFLAVNAACHPMRSSSPDVENAKTEPQVAQLHEVVDPTGRWRSQVTLRGVPRLHALPGHVRIEFSPDAAVAANCFVYEQPILAGEATAQLLRALAPGLEFREFSALDIRVLNHTPLIAFSFEFEATLGDKDQGAIDIFVFPRVEHPAMCSVETTLSSEDSSAESDRATALHQAREFLANLNVTQPVSIALDEVWLLKDQGNPVGFRHVRVERAGSFYATTTRGGRFSLTEEGMLNADRVEQELEDETGLVRMTWLELADGKVELRGQMERKEDGYRYALERAGVGSSGRFEVSTPLLGSVTLHRLLRTAGPGQALDYYLPQLRADGPSSCGLLASNDGPRGPCVACTAPIEGQPTAPSDPGLHQAPSMTRTAWFAVESEHLSLRLTGNMGCDAQPASASARAEQTFLAAEQGAWPSF